VGVVGGDGVGEVGGIGGEEGGSTTVKPNV
jgi:hypothetical protein